MRRYRVVTRAKTTFAWVAHPSNDRRVAQGLKASRLPPTEDSSLESLSGASLPGRHEKLMPTLVPSWRRMKIVPDTSVVIDGRITQIVRRKRPGEAEVVVPEAVVAELEAQADRGQETGYKGLDELRELAAMASRGHIKLRYTGPRPTLEQIRLAGGGEIDAMIRDVAQQEEAIFITSDSVQARVAEAKGIPTEYLKAKVDESDESKPMRLLDYLGPQVMSVHLKSNAVPRIKVGIPGDMRLEEVGKEVLTDRDLKEITKEIIDATRNTKKGFIEMDEGGATVIQIENMRIAIARPPFSSAWEITAVRPVARVSLEKYDMSDIIKERLNEKYKGVLVAGPPGAGKSTLAQAMADYLESRGWIVKTMERPRDLQVGENITQYTALEGDMAKTADLLLLVRPDYTIYDEVRKTSDVEVFADLRLAGVGMVGVIHATRPIDAIQRLIGRVELGMIAQVVDTVVFVEDGKVKTLFDLRFTVKVPSGMIEADLARPVIEVVDHKSGKVAFEIYTYGEEVVVMPVESITSANPMWSLAEKQISKVISRLVSGPIQVEVEGNGRAAVFVKEDEIGALLGRGGSRIQELERDLGIHIDVRDISDISIKDRAKRTIERSANVTMDKKGVSLVVGPDLKGRSVELIVGGETIFTGTVGRDGFLRFSKNSEEGKALQQAYFTHDEVLIRASDSDEQRRR